MTDVLIPWMPGDDYRVKNFAWVKEWWESNGFNVIIGESAHEPFSRSAARNDAFRQSKADLIVVADADTYAPMSNVREALAAAQREETWALPYDVYYNAAQEVTAEILARPGWEIPEEEIVYEHKIEDATCGLLCMQRDAYSEVGTYDEGFAGWGYEDNAMHCALSALWGPLHRVSGYCVHLWHPVSHQDTFGQPEIDHNRERYQRYRRLKNNPQGMRKLIEAR